MSIRDIIKNKRIEKGLTMKELADKIEVSEATISRWESGEISNIKHKHIILMSNVLDISPNIIMGWEDEKEEEPTQKALRINVYGYVPAGVPVDAIEDIIDWEEVPADWAKGGKEYIALEVKGDSMYPKYIEKDRIIIERSPDCNSGDDCVVYVNGYESTLKTVIKNNDGTITLKPYNPTYSPRTYSQKSEDDFVEIFGIVREIRRKP